MFQSAKTIIRPQLPNLQNKTKYSAIVFILVINQLEAHNFVLQ